MLSDLDIAQAAEIKHIKTIAAKIGITEDDLQYYGKNKAKLPLELIDHTLDSDMVLSHPIQ